MEPTPFATGAVALGFALVHVLGSRMRFLQVTPRSLWLSFAGGVSLAYVFVHLLPELSARQAHAAEALGEAAALEELYVYLTALAGLLVFYGLDRLVRRTGSGRSGGAAAPLGVFWVHVGAYALYSVLIGYLLVHREEPGLAALLLYAVALSLHFIVNDQGLRQYHGREYDGEARWLLAAAPLAGWGLGLAVDLSSVAVATIFGFLAGGIVLNVLKEELPEDRESRFSALLGGVVLFSALLLLAA